MKIAMGKRWRPFAGTCLAVTCLASHAATLDLEVGAQHTDNVSRTPTNEQAETIALAGLGFGAAFDRPRLDGAIGANFQYRRYMDDSYDDEIVGGLNAGLTYAFVPDRFTWLLEDNFGQISTNRVQVETPANRQNFNYLTTGPDLTFPMGSRTAAQLTARWSDTYYEVTDEDSNTQSASLAFIRSLSDMNSVSVNGSLSKIDYDSESTALGSQYQDSEITEGFLRLDANGLRTTLLVDAGYTKTTRDENSSDGMLFRLEATREITSRSSLSFSAGSEFADTGSAFRLDQSFFGVQPENQEAIAVADVFRTTYAYLGLSTKQDRMSFTVALNASRERYERDDIFDRDILGASVLFSRRLSPRVSFEATGRYSKDEFINGNVEFDEWSVGLGASWQLTRAWSLRVNADRLSGSGGGSSRDFDENRASLTLHYSIGQTIS